jgi:TPR repeat protein
MKKLLLATALALSTQLSFANPVDAFAEVKTLLQAQDQTGAFQALEKLAKTNNADALYNLGYLTEIGQGTQQNNKKAVQYYEKAAKKGSSLANFVLAKSYETGRLDLKVNT